MRVVALALAAPFCACGEPVRPSAREIETPENTSFAARLARARPGDVVTLESSVTGSFRVPAGVSVRGTTGASIEARGGAGLLLLPGDTDEPTTLTGLTITVPAGEAVAAIFGDAVGDVTISAVTLDVRAGVGIVLAGAGRVGIIDTRVNTMSEGAPIVAELALRADRRGLLGVVVTDCESLEVRDVTIEGIEGISAAAARCDVAMSRVLVHAHAGTGIRIDASDATLDDVAIAGGREWRFASALQGAPALHLVGTQADARTLDVVGNANIGTMAVGGALTLADTRLIDNRSGGLWIFGGSPGDIPTVAMRDTRLSGNGGVHVWAAGARVEVATTLLGPVRGRTLPDDEGRPVAHADALVIRGSPTAPGTLDVDDATSWGSGRTTLLAQGNVNATRLSVDASPLRACGEPPPRSGWSCATDGGARVCVRSTVTAIDPAWVCADDRDGVLCSSPADTAPSSSPQLVAGAPLHALLPVADDCARAVTDLATATGLSAEPLLRNYPGVSAAAPASSAEIPWTCNTRGGTRECRRTHPNDAILIDDVDNPVSEDAPGWSCQNTTSGRTCASTVASTALRDGAVVEAGTMIVDPDLAARTGSLEASRVLGGTRWVPAAVPTAPLLVDGDGLARDRLVGASGVFDAEGRTRPGTRITDQGLLTD